MEVKYIGGQRDERAGDPDVITQYGISFERTRPGKGDWVVVPDDHPFVGKFRGNPHFEVKGRKDEELLAQRSTEGTDGPLPKPVPTDVEQTINQEPETADSSRRGRSKVE